MKKVTPVLMAIVFCALLLAGCSISSQSRQGQPLAVYSFSGENEFISVSNGVIVLDAEEEICYGGNLETRKDKFTDIASYSATIYLTSDGEENILMSNRVEDKTGGAINISEDIGKITGDILIPDDIDNLVDGLWFELKTVDLDGEENTYHLQLEVIEITRANDNSPSVLTRVTWSRSPHLNGRGEGFCPEDRSRGKRVQGVDGLTFPPPQDTIELFPKLSPLPCYCSDFPGILAGRPGCRGLAQQDTAGGLPHETVQVPTYWDGTTKTAVAVMLSYLIFVPFGLLYNESYPGVLAYVGPTYSCIACIVCMQSSLEQTLQVGLSRFVGVFIGAILGWLCCSWSPCCPTGWASS